MNNFKYYRQKLFINIKYYTCMYLTDFSLFFFLLSLSSLSLSLSLPLFFLLLMVATRFEEAFMSAAFMRRFSSCSREYHHSTVDHLLYLLYLYTTPPGVIRSPRVSLSGTKKMKLAISIKSKYADNIKVPKGAGASAHFFANGPI